MACHLGAMSKETTSPKENRLRPQNLPAVPENDPLPEDESDGPLGAFAITVERITSLGKIFRYGPGI